MSLRFLVGCDACHRQYDASQREGGNRFHCSCGELITVPEARKVHNASVVRCSSCGAARHGKTAACGFCGSDFSLHERDLHTVCPTCTARISDRARYCHYCATPILPEGNAGERTDFICPVCGTGNHLASRSLGGERLSVLECGKCAGLWLGSQIFQLLEQRAQRVAASGEMVAPDHRPQVASDSLATTGAPFYKHCPLCTKLMHRRNYGGKSGIIVDTCKQDGIWFDQGELDAVLRWIKSGALAKAHEDTHRKLEQAKREQRYRHPTPPGPNSYMLGKDIGGSLDLGDFVGELIDLL
ncbi:MAG: zinc ribbon domain-containing protein [Gammaproteobacteria bacterium]|nr:zinc ribbon domain-containing protein [Gammaproteobacteria bacterium]